jgi:uncharacterized protein YndB with AHSA1/START domain
MVDTSKGFTLSREFLATPQAIWNAWTDADEISQWWHPVGVATPRELVSVDLRVGGEYSYTMIDPATGDGITSGGVYRELSENQKLLFTWGNPADPANDSPVVAVTIESLGELTRMTFDLRGVEGFSGDGFFFDGWESALDSLATHLMGSEPIG